MLDDTILTTLLEAEDPGKKISIYMPTHPVSSGQAVQEDGIRFKNALSSIQASDDYDESAMSDTMDELHELANDMDFWKHRTVSLAIFADKDGYQTVSLPYDLTEACYVDDQYRIGPLVAMQGLGSDFFLLDINHTRPRLLEGTPSGCSELVIKDMPGSFESMTEDTEYGKELQHQSGGVGSFHGHDDEAALQDDAMRYYKKIAGAVDAHISDHTEPLLLAGVQSRVAAMRPLLSYSHALDDYLEGNSEAMNEQELYNKATPVIEGFNAKRRSDLVQEFNETVPGRTATGTEGIESAASNGRVAKLLLPCFRQTADTVRDGKGESIVLQLADDDMETEELVRSVLAQGGEVMAVSVDAFDDEQPRAICRF